MNEPNVIFRPHPGAQTRFMQWDGRYGLIGGAAGGGKSMCLQYDPMRQVLVESGRVERGEIATSTGRAIFFRRTMPELREVLDRAKRTFPLIDSRVDWNEASKTFTFACGYKYMFAQMEDPGDWMKYYGFEFTYIAFDELTTFTEEQFEQLDTRLRSSDPILKNMLWLRAGTNPVGIGLEWVRRRFVEVAPPGTPVIRRIETPVVVDGVTHFETVEHRQLFIPARLSDNPSIDQAQYAATLVTKSSATKRQLLDGDWYVSQGACFADLWEQDIHVCKPFKIPAGWDRYRSGDYGVSWPGLSSIQWWAVDRDGNLTCYRSLTIGGHNSEMLAYRIKEIEMDAGEWDVERGCSKLTGPLDAACWGEHGHIGPTIAGAMLNVGVNWVKSTKVRNNAVDQFRVRLAHRSAHPTVKNDDGKPAYIVPGIRWFNTCWNHVKRPSGKVKVGPIVTIPVLPASETNPDVPESKGTNDHDFDSAAYMCAFMPMSSQDDRVPADELDELARYRRKAETQAASGSRSGYWKGL